ncbi:MAG TPA: hypothetical protein VGL38_02140 [bacterium]
MSGAGPDPAPRTVRVYYDPRIITPKELVQTVDRADIRLQVRHRLIHWLGLLKPVKGARRTQILSDEPE